MTKTERAIIEVTRACLDGSRKATKYLAADLTVKGARRHKPNRRSRYVEVLLTVGQPNYAERRFIHTAKKSGEPFPIRKVQLRGWTS